MTIIKLNNKGFIAFLLVLLFTIAILLYKNTSEYFELKEAFKLEKKELTLELNNLLENYEENLYEKHEISLKLRDKLHEIIKLKDTISNLKTTDYNLFRFYRKRISNLTIQNKILFSHIDSLNIRNNKLLIKNDSVREILAQKKTQNSKLKHKNNFLHQEKKVLKEKIAIAEIIKVSNVKVEAMKTRRSGRHTTTRRSRRTTAFKIAFNLLENKIINSGIKAIYIQIVYNNKVIMPAKKAVLKNEEKILCNDILNIEYNNKPLSILSFIDVSNHTINKGSYQINIFIDGIFTKKATIELK